ncbi:uncharacterized protein V6R79_020168 [Siganus canaliculatus]
MVRRKQRKIKSKARSEAEPRSALLLQTSGLSPSSRGSLLLLLLSAERRSDEQPDARSSRTHFNDKDAPTGRRQPDCWRQERTAGAPTRAGDISEQTRAAADPEGGLRSGEELDPGPQQRPELKGR